MAIEFFNGVLGSFALNVLAFVRMIIILIIVIVAFGIILRMVKKALLKRAKTKEAISNIKTYSKIVNSIFVIFIIFVAIFSYVGSWTGLGLAAGLMTAALGWALQRPITGMAAWLMIAIRRPFKIGDRIIVAGMRGDVMDISLTHIYLSEVGGIATSEEKSGRIIMVPNSILFEQNIINYTLDNDFILDEVMVSVTYSSNLHKAKKIAVDVVKKVLKDLGIKQAEKPYYRTYFQPSGINLHLRYFVIAERRQEVSSVVTEEVYNAFRKERDIEFAYPHTKVILDRGKE